MHNSAWLGKLFLPAWRHCLLSRQLQLRRENVVLRLHEKLVRGGAPRSTSARGCGPKSVKVVANWTLLDVEMGASNELPLTIRQSFKDGRYSPSTGMEEVEWKIMLEQFIASAVVV
jgi:hypothetical protein